MALTAAEQLYFDQVEPLVISDVLTAESVTQAVYDSWTADAKRDAVQKQWNSYSKALAPHTPSATTVILADPVN